MHVVEPGLLGIDHDLHEPGRVAYVEEHDAAVVAPVRDPAAHDDRRADVLGAQITRSVRAHHQADSCLSHSQYGGDFLARDLDLFSARQILHCDLSVGELARTEHHAPSCTHSIRGAPLFLHRSVPVRAVRGEIQPRAARSPT